MHTKFLLATGLIGAAAASPAEGYPKNYPAPYGKAKAVVAKFDDLTALAVINDFLPIGPYKYLNYEGFSAGTETVPITDVQLFGVQPHSPPNYAYADRIMGLFVGPALDVDYEGSKTKAFDLHSFYFACVDVTSTPVATPLNCIVAVTGYQGETEVATQAFEYDKDDVLEGDLDAPMALAKLNKHFKGLTRVEYEYEQVINTDTPPSMLVDDVKYTVYLEK